MGRNYYADYKYMITREKNITLEKTVVELIAALKVAQKRYTEGRDEWNTKYYQQWRVDTKSIPADCIAAGNP